MIAPVDKTELRLSSLAVLVSGWLVKNRDKDTRGYVANYQLTMQTLLSIFAYYRLAYHETQLGIVPRAMAVSRGLSLIHPELSIRGVTTDTLEIHTE